MFQLILKTQASLLNEKRLHSAHVDTTWHSSFFVLAFNKATDITLHDTNFVFSLHQIWEDMYGDLIIYLTSKAFAANAA